jgi:hypothetical protein
MEKIPLYLHLLSCCTDSFISNKLVSTQCFHKSRRNSSQAIEPGEKEKVRWTEIAKAFKHVDDQGNMVRRSENFIKNYWCNTIQSVIKDYLKVERPDDVRSFDSIGKFLQL